MKHRILYIHHGVGVGGAGVSLLYLLRKLDRERYAPIVLCLHEGASADLFRSEGIETYIDTAIRDFSHTTLVSYSLRYFGTFALSILRFPFSIRAAIRFLRDHPVDLIHLNSSSLSACALAAKRFGVPVVWHIREPLAPGYQGIRRALLRYAIQHYANRVIAICEYDASQLIRDERVRVIYNFVDFDRFDRHRSGADFRKELGIRPGTKLVAMLGGVSKAKGTREFVEALKIVRQRFADVKFVVVGEMPTVKKDATSFRNRLGTYSDYVQYYESIHSFLAQEGLAQDLIFTGVCLDVPKIIAACDLIVVPSTVPHFGRPIIEAGAMSKPVVASDLGGPRELVVHGETGLLVPASNASALADAIIRILSNPDLAARMGEAGYARANALFDAEVNSARVMETYQEIFENRARAHRVN